MQDSVESVESAKEARSTPATPQDFVAPGLVPEDSPLYGRVFETTPRTVFVSGSQPQTNTPVPTVVPSVPAVVPSSELASLPPITLQQPQAPDQAPVKPLPKPQQHKYDEDIVFSRKPKKNKKKKKYGKYYCTFSRI